jgi:hypothetical protein
MRNRPHPELAAPTGTVYASFHGKAGDHLGCHEPRPSRDGHNYRMVRHTVDNDLTLSYVPAIT